ncbi:MAG: GerMN domain-containing protein [Candidatus Omnitrophota bacterium]
MKKKLIYSLVILASIFFAISLVIFFKSSSHLRKDNLHSVRARSGSEIKETVIINVKAFFFTDGPSLTRPVSAKLEVTPIKEVAYTKFLDFLFQGQEGCITPIPPEVKLRSLYYLEKQHMLILDFSEELIAQFPGGSDSELEFIYFIVDNMCYNFKEIQKVKFLVSGNEYPTLSGHIDLENPFYPNYAFLDIDE